MPTQNSTLFWIFMGVGFFLIFLGAFVHYIRLRQIRNDCAYDCHSTIVVTTDSPQGYPGYQVMPQGQAQPYQPNPQNYETPKPQDYYYQNNGAAFPQQQQAPPQYYQPQVFSSQPPQ